MTNTRWGDLTSRFKKTNSSTSVRFSDKKGFHTRPQSIFSRKDIAVRLGISWGDKQVRKVRAKGVEQVKAVLVHEFGPERAGILLTAVGLDGATAIVSKNHIAQLENEAKDLLSRTEIVNRYANEVLRKEVEEKGLGHQSPAVEDEAGWAEVKNYFADAYLSIAEKDRVDDSFGECLLSAVLFHAQVSKSPARLAPVIAAAVDESVSKYGCSLGEARTGVARALMENKSTKDQMIIRARWAHDLHRPESERLEIVEDGVRYNVTGIDKDDFASFLRVDPDLRRPDVSMFELVRASAKTYWRDQVEVFVKAGGKPADISGFVEQVFGADDAAAETIAAQMPEEFCKLVHLSHRIVATKTTFTIPLQEAEADRAKGCLKNMMNNNYFVLRGVNGALLDHTEEFQLMTSSLQHGVNAGGAYGGYVNRLANAVAARGEALMRSGDEERQVIEELEPAQALGLKPIVRTAVRTKALLRTGKEPKTKKARKVKREATLSTKGVDVNKLIRQFDSNIDKKI